MGLAKFSISAAEIGYGSEITVNGEPVPAVRRAQLNLVVGDIPRLTLELLGGGEIEGEGIVEVAGSADPRECVESFLNGVDTDVIDQRLLAGSVDEPFNTRRVIGELLKVLDGA